jgi:phosphotransferase system  glucose/maltose/N-acetylglucosamine-specific IIC component
MIHTAFAATYTVKSLFQSIITVIVNPLVIFLSALAIMLFLWGLLQFMANAGSEEGREIGKRHMINGLIGLFIMISVYGIMNFITNTFGFKKPDTTNLNSKGTEYQFKQPYERYNSNSNPEIINQPDN